MKIQKAAKNFLTTAQSHCEQLWKTIHAAVAVCDGNVCAYVLLEWVCTHNNKTLPTAFAKIPTTVISQEDKHS